MQANGPCNALVVQGVVNSVSLEDVISLSRSTAVGAALAQPQVYGKAAQQHALCMYLVAQDIMRAEVGRNVAA